MKRSHCWWITVLIVALLAVLTAGCGFMIAAKENSKVRRMNNTYINSDYAGWTRVVFFEKHTFELPESWQTVSLDNDTYALYQDDTLVAYVGKLGDDSQYAETCYFCAAVVGSEEIETPYEQAGTEQYGNGCSSYLLTASKSNAEQEKYYYLFSQRFTGTRDEKCGMLFLNDGIAQTELFDYVIAIAYSYELR